MITVKLKDNDKYTPSPFNPVMDSKYESDGILMRIVKNGLAYIDINYVLDIKHALVYKLINHPAIVRWDNNMADNISGYRLTDLIYYDNLNNAYEIVNNNLVKLNEKQKFKSIW